MQVQKRPGGLTALAVLNFVFAAFGLLAVVGLIVLIKFAGAASQTGSPQDQAVMRAFAELGMGLYVMMLVGSVLGSALLIIAGVGYLKTRRWGRKAGTAYGLIALATVVLETMLIPSEIGGGFNIGTIIGLVYPVLTLILLNTTFKDDLSN